MSGVLTDLPPWLQSGHDALCRLKAQDKFAHAYLFGGQAGLGKNLAAGYLAATVLCSNGASGAPCRQCRECELLRAQTHPDLKFIAPEDGARDIKIDQIRESIEFLSQTSRRGGYKVVLISPAEMMNLNAANALLKVLEEPTPKSLLILVSHQPALLLATVRSRCHLIKFTRPPVEQVIPWLESKNIRAPAAELLKLANNLPLRALALADEDALHDRSVLHRNLGRLMNGETTIAEAAAECAKFSITDNIESLILCTMDILSSNQGLTIALDDSELHSMAEKCRNRTTMKALHDFYRELLQAKKAVTGTSNPNLVLVLESLFHRWAQITGSH